MKVEITIGRLKSKFKRLMDLSSITYLKNINDLFYFSRIIHNIIQINNLENFN